jgi:hypothetical protein
MSVIARCAEQPSMNRIRSRNWVVPSVIISLGLSSSAFSGLALSARNGRSVRSTIYISTVNVTVRDKETGAPVKDLSYRDFQVLDDGHPVTTATFSSASSHNLRPLTIWLLVTCIKPPDAQGALRHLFGKSGPVGQPLSTLNSNSHIGVAHWCGSNDAQIDLPPTQDRDALTKAIDSIREPAPKDSAEPAGGRAFQRALDLISENVGLENRPALPVIIVLHDGKLAMSQAEAELASKKLLYRGVIVYQIRDHDEDIGHSSPSGQGSTLGFICTQTGGRIVPVQHGDYGEAMTSIVGTLQSRYELGVAPRAVDRQWHEIRVLLTDPALRAHKTVELEYGAGYLADFSFGSSPPYSTSNYHTTTNPQLDPDFNSAIESPNLTHAVRFEAKAHGFIGEPDLAEYSLQLDSNEITWSTLPNGDRHSEISIAVASFSAGGQKLDDKIVQFEILRDEAHLPITGDRPFTYSVTEMMPKNTARIRLAIRDAATGRVGVRDFSIEEISDAPKSPAVIL